MEYLHKKNKAQLRSYRQTKKSRAEWPNSAWPGYGFLYVIALKEEGPCKVGISVKPRSRIQGLETGAGVRYPFVFISRECSDFREIEQHILERLQVYRTIGEWLDMPFEWGVHAVEHMEPNYMSTQKRNKLLRAAADRVQPISALPLQGCLESG